MTKPLTILITLEAGFKLPLVDSYNNPAKCSGGNFSNTSKIKRIY